MRQAFEMVGLGKFCVPLLQGVALSAPLSMESAPVIISSECCSAKPFGKSSYFIILT